MHIYLPIVFYNDLLAESKLREGEGEERSINAYAGARAESLLSPKKKTFL